MATLMNRLTIKRLPTAAKEKKMRFKKLRCFAIAAAVCALACAMALPASAAECFDAAYYASAYPDVAAAVGSDSEALLNHYLSYGKAEGRVPYSGAEPGTDVFVPVPMSELANLKSLRKKASDDELRQAYDIAVQLVAPYAELSREEQLKGIATALRDRFESGMTYSMSAEHYNDPYGYLVLGSASCAGCTRTTGLCLNILGIPYEHVNENQYSHQWCRVDMGNGVYWICDAYGLYCGPEPAPYCHPYVQV